ncbi:MAG: hypothetical protein WB785_07405 [Mycobacterium sp.]
MRPTSPWPESRFTYANAVLPEAMTAAVDTNPIWLAGISVAAAWFMNDNDTGEPMLDPDTGGGDDGLQAGGVNMGQGA